MENPVVEAEPVQIEVDTDVHLPSRLTPRKVLSALRRQLRQHNLGPAPKSNGPQNPLNLLETREGRHRMPQGMLPRLTETFRRYDIPFSIVDRRAMVDCPALHSRARLSRLEKEALRSLLLRDSGVIICSAPAERLNLTAELIARRRQRCLIAVDSPATAAWWLTELRQQLNLSAPRLQSLTAANQETWVVVGQHDSINALPARALSHDFGMVIFDELTSASALTLMRTIRAVGARYMVGFAEAPSREDRLHNPIFLALGGVVHRISASKAADRLPLVCRFIPTAFDFAYQGRSQYQALLGALATDSERCRRIAQDVASEARDGHSCLVLSDRRDHLEQLAAHLPQELHSEQLTSAIRPAQRSRIISRFERGELTVLLATSQIAVESINTPRLQRLFLIFPFSYTKKLERLIQCLVQPSAGLGQAVLYDYDDIEVELLHRTFEKRKQFLEKLRRLTEQPAGQALQLSLPLDSAEQYSEVDDAG